ncbi:hypothetical protein FRB90_008148, partial [Tulasnella sp. 427]
MSLPIHRTPLHELSNDYSFAEPTSPSFSSPIPQRQRKRPRLSEQENGDDLLKASNKPITRLTVTEGTAHAVQDTLPRKQLTSTFARLHAATLSTRRLAFTRPSAAPILQSLVSSHHSDVFKIHSTSSQHTFDLPVSCAFSNNTKQGNGPWLLAVSTEEGKVEIMDTRRRGDMDPEPSRKTIQPHAGAIFDVRWSKDDSRLLTGSGDASCSMLDVETGETYATLSGAHISSVKQVQWNPYNSSVFASGSRDGGVHIWDLRVSSEGTYKPVQSIVQAHRDPPKKGTRTKGTGNGARSITSIIYSLQRDDVIYTSSSANGIIKMWDLRGPTKRAALQCEETSVDSTMQGISSSGLTRQPSFMDTLAASTDNGVNTSPKRARGICSMALDPTGSTIYAVAADSRIHRYSALTLAPPTPLSSSTAEPFTDPRLRVSSFYVRTSVSPCGQWLASGSSGGQVFLWSLDGASSCDRASAVLDAKWNGEADVKESAAVDWACDGTLASCSDDRTVRVWRSDLDRAMRCRDDEATARADWAWAE